MSFHGRLLFGLALLTSAGCSSAGPTNNNGNNNPNPPGLPGGTPALAASVTVDDNLFTPNSVLLAAGGEVTWNWIGDGHSVTSSGSPTFSPNAPVRSAPFSLVVTFSTVGDYRYYCTVHGQPNYYSSGDMVGTVFVR
jgi:plastocyanin